MGVFSSFNTTLGSEVYVISNSTIENFQFFTSNNSITILVSRSSMAQAYGFCRIRIPHIVIDEPYTVIINGAKPIYSNYSLQDDGRNRWIYFTYEHSSLEIVLIPEFPSSTTLISFVGLILLVVFAYRRRNWSVHPKRTTRYI